MFNINERRQKVNIMNEIQLITTAVDILNEKTNLNAQYIENARYEIDAVDGQLKLPQLNIPLQIECKKKLQNPSTLQNVVNRFLDTEKPFLLVTEYVTPTLAQTLKQLGLQYFDTVGNAYIKQFPVHIDIQGNKPNKVDKTEMLAKQIGKAFQPKGMKIIFMLLTKPELLNEPMRTIAAEAEVALGTVKQVLDDLTYQGFIVQKGKQKKVLIERTRLMEKWLDAYPENFEAKQVQEVFATDDIQNITDLNLGAYRCALGGEIAAEFYDHYLKAKDILVYVPAIQKRDFLKVARLKKSGVDTIVKHKVTLVEPMLNIEKLTGDKEELAHPLLVYAQLMATNAPRNIDAARRLYEQQLA
ncbi:hypothetical protein JQC92_21340 [Shewanella sp. 202IG2-18]|uniref:type IV toxin-antitoxin system AbiEi family antitoxin n=1 Tax=Parashewanella hymeniacidonis TaxID=2807618 RepID=UPI001960DE0A|nr:type IV toxin-antitoxin system AbiEi family antitoxin [Parashewanella hymeniacidonis]MBM7074529.1 hypothetical protein [Parashewanella hymeniacidonis]